VKNKVYFFLSAGRCGTQTLCATLGRLRPDAVVLHEGIKGDFRYADKAYEFLRMVMSLSERQDVIITGWPTFIWLPMFKMHLGSRMVIIPLFRNAEDQISSLRGHDLENRVDDMAKMIPWGDVDAFVGEIATMYARLRCWCIDAFKFEDIFFGNQDETARLAFLLDVDAEELRTSLMNKVDAWPSRKQNAVLEGA
jgi:hypothetical protein